MFEPECTDEQYTDIYERVDKTRKGSVYVKLPVEAVKALLVDHAELHKIVEDTRL